MNSGNHSNYSHSGNHRAGGSSGNRRQGGQGRPEAYPRSSAGHSPRSAGARSSSGSPSRSADGRHPSGHSARSTGARSSSGHPSRSARPSAPEYSRTAQRQSAATLKTDSRNRSYQPPNDDEDKLPISVYFGIGVTVVAVIALIVSIIVNSSGSKKNRPAIYDDNTEVSQIDVIDEPIVDVSEEEVSDEVSSQKENMRFVGTWYKTDVPASERAILSVTMQYSDSFEFRFEIRSEGKSVVINDTAFYTDETHAEFSPKKNSKIIFERGEDSVTVTHKGKNSAFGIKENYVIDGQFTEEEPEDEGDIPEESPASSYDYYLYNSDAIKKALADTLSAEDYELYQDMMANGLKSPVEYEHTTDKNGNPVNVDQELNAVKYYAQLNSRDYEMVFICSENANIYLLFYNSDEVIYCTNDSNYKKKMPASFQAVADSKGVKPTFR